MTDPTDAPSPAAPGVDAWWSGAALEGVPSALAAAGAAVDAMLRSLSPRGTGPELTAESLVRGAVASAHLEGSTSTDADMRAGRGDALARAALAVNAELLALVATVRRSPVQALARLHAVAARGLVSDDELGRPRPHPEVAARLQAAGHAITTAPRDVPAIAVAALAHAEVAAMTPFAGLNGVVGRAFERLILVSRGVDPTSVLVSEAGHDLLSESYTLGLERYRSGGVVGQRAWLLHSAAAITEAVAESPPARASGAP